ncbi:hypothetical protein A8C75_12050 [Marinobacterium aestuarii]|uniref:Uncharacterized protein n=1 Tax=Marinobacterium aestuarii TaxID=1821621 RepID=A0A1A9EZ64_9GAMM|nr:hypothetical protein [Marinobacterium aestuarii]ANG63132.1 hypothetical protein A8C75_12050 [Marinobacterium aestuarii]
MAKHEEELKLVTQRRGKWSQSGVPHKGWSCEYIEDLGSPSEVCHMCESQNIRYVHYMSHHEYPEVLAVGCVCAGHMEDDLNAAKERDVQMHSRARKRKQWLSRVWKVSQKGYDYIKSDGYIVTVYPKEKSWGATIAAEKFDFVKHSYLFYKTQEKAKLAAFDVITKLLARKKNEYKP